MCTRPITLTDTLPTGQCVTRVVPCGKCDECRCKARNEYAALCTLAAKQLGSMHFFTLTYSNSRVPVHRVSGFNGDLSEVPVVDYEYRGCETLAVPFEDSWCVIRDVLYVLSLKRKDVADILKLFRQNEFRLTGSRPAFKMSFFGEYGSRTHRPHYHLLTFGLSDMQAFRLRDLWVEKYGFVHLDSIPYFNSDGSPAFAKVSLYVSKYISKRDTLPWFVSWGAAETPRRQSSLSLGRDFSPSDRVNLSNFILHAMQLLRLNLN